MIEITFGTSVRALVREYLENFNRQTICLFPEWLCYSMTEEISSIATIYYYNVNAMKNSNYPLEVDSHDCLSKVSKLINDNQHELVVLLAFPCGYLDPNVNFLIEKLRDFSTVHILLDIAQAYGCIELTPFILKSDAVYLSFNSNKLLNSGGAISLTSVIDQEKNCFEKFQQLNSIIMHAYMQQRKNYYDLMVQLNQDHSLQKYHQQYEHCVRGNFYRTVLSGVNDELKIWLSANGYGQTLLDYPQKTNALPSSHYQQWAEHSYLLFPSQRQVLA